MLEKKLMLKKVSGSSLLEVVIALVLVMVVFGIAMSLFINVTRSSNSLQQLNGGLLLHELYLKTTKEKSYYDEKIQSGSNIIHKKISKYKNLSSLLLIELTIINPEEKILFSRKDILLAEDEN